MRKNRELKKRAGRRPYYFGIKHIDRMGRHPQGTHIESRRRPNDGPDVRGVLQHVAIQAEDPGLRQYGGLVPGRLMHDGQGAARGFDIGQLGQLVLGTTVDGATAADNILHDFRWLSFEKRGSDDETDDVLGRRLHQFQDRFCPFKYKHPLAVARAFGLNHISYVREKIAGNGAKCGGQSYPEGRRPCRGPAEPASPSTSTYLRFLPEAASAARIRCARTLARLRADSLPRVRSRSAFNRSS